MKKYSRKKKLINSSLQLKLVGAFLGVSCIAALFQVILLNRSMLELSRKLAGQGDVILTDLPGILGQNVLITFLVLVPLMLTVGVLVTHRIAGPAYGMQRYLARIAESGKIPGPCRIREGDELQDLCAAINAAFAAISSETVDEESGDTSGELDSTPGLVDAAEDEVVAEKGEAVES